MRKRSIIWLSLVAVTILVITHRPEAATGSAQATDAINKYLAAMGGQEALSKVRDYTFNGSARVSVMGQGVNGKFTFTVKAPARWRETLTSTDFVSESGCDGTHLWAVGNGQVRKVSELQQQIELEWAGMKILTGPPREGWTAKLLERQTISGKEVIVIELTAPSGRSAQYFLDAKTYLLVRSVVPGYNPMSKKETEASTDFEKYQQVGQFMLPHWIFNSNGFISKEIEVSEWKFNTGPSDSLFALPQPEDVKPDTTKPTSRGL